MSAERPGPSPEHGGREAVFSTAFEATHPTDQQRQLFYNLLSLVAAKEREAAQAHGDAEAALDLAEQADTRVEALAGDLIVEAEKVQGFLARLAELEQQSLKESAENRQLRHDLAEAQAKIRSLEYEVSEFTEGMDEREVHVCTPEQIETLRLLGRLTHEIDLYVYVENPKAVAALALSRDAQGRLVIGYDPNNLPDAADLRQGVHGKIRIGGSPYKVQDLDPTIFQREKEGQ